MTEIHKLPKKPKVIVIGIDCYLGVQLARQLIANSLAPIGLVSDVKDIHQSYRIFFKNSGIEIHSLAKNIQLTKHHPSYIISLVSCSQGNYYQNINQLSQILSQIIQASNISSTRSVLVIPNDRRLLSKISTQQFSFSNHTKVIVKDGFGSTLGENSFLPLNAAFSKFQQGKILLPYLESTIVNPLLDSDIGQLIIKSMLSSATRGKLIAIEGKQSITILNFCLKIRNQLLTKYNLQLTLTSNISKTDPINVSFDYVLTPQNNSSLDESISTILKYIVSSLPFHKQIKQIPPTPTTVSTVPFKRKQVRKPQDSLPVKTHQRYRHRLLFIFVTISLLLVGILGFTSPLIPSIALLSLKQVNPTNLPYDQDNYVFQAKKYDQLAQSYLKAVNLSSGFPSLISQRLGQYLQKRTYENLFNLYAQSSNTHLVELLDYILGVGSIDINSALTNTNNHLHQALIYANNTQVDADNDISQSYQNAHQIVEVLSPILSNQSPSTYLILFQDSQELRPTGGYINSVGVVTLESGQIQNLETKSVYQLDSLLKGAVTPPLTLKEQLGETNWYFRDVNWHPNFYQSAQQAAWFYEKETGQQVDGVIALNNLALTPMLKAIDGVEINNGLYITGNNFDYQHYIAAGENSNPSTNNHQLFAIVVEAILNKIPQLEEPSKLAFIKAVNHGLTTGQILVASFDPQTQIAMSNLGWNGAVVYPSCPIDDPEISCLVDYLHINEANIGINKSNHFISRQHHHQTEYNQNSISKTHTVVYSNSAVTDQWPSGDYQAYTRIFVPAFATIKSVVVDGHRIPNIQIDTFVDDNFAVVGVPLTVPVGEKATLEIKYQYPFSRVEDYPERHFIYIKKQSGILADPITFEFAGHPNLSYDHDNNLLTVQGARLVSDLAQDISLMVALD